MLGGGKIWEDGGRTWKNTRGDSAKGDRLEGGVLLEAPRKNMEEHAGGLGEG